MITESITITLDQAVLGKLYVHAAEHGLRMPEMAARLIEEGVGQGGSSQAGDTADLSGHVDEAVGRARAKSKGDQFKVEDLFTSKEWDLIPSHKTLGRRFAKLASEQGLVTQLPKRNGATVATYERR